MSVDDRIEWQNGFVMNGSFEWVPREKPKGMNDEE